VDRQSRLEPRARRLAIEDRAADHNGSRCRGNSALESWLTFYARQSVPDLASHLRRSPMTIARFSQSGYEIRVRDTRASIKRAEVQVSGYDVFVRLRRRPSLPTGCSTSDSFHGGRAGQYPARFLMSWRFSACCRPTRCSASQRSPGRKTPGKARRRFRCDELPPRGIRRQEGGRRDPRYGPATPVRRRYSRLAVRHAPPSGEAR